jgi:Flp pilus assembly protein TadB
VVTILSLSQLELLAVLAGAVAGGGAFLLTVAVRGLPPAPPGRRQDRLSGRLRELAGIRGAIALVAGIAALVATGWVVAGIGVAGLAFSWRGMSGAAGERRAIARLEALATWTESLRDTIAGAVGLEQAIPASLRVAAPSLQPHLVSLVDRMHTRMPMADALARFADDLNDPGADLIIAALVINARLRGPGLRDLLTSLSGSVREELDVRRRVTADRRSTRRSVQIVVLVSVGMAVLLAVFDHAFLTPYDGVLGQIVLAVVVAVYAVGILWLRRLARFETPQRLFTAAGGLAAAGSAAEQSRADPAPAASAASPPGPPSPVNHDGPRARTAARQGGPA